MEKYLIKVLVQCCQTHTHIHSKKYLNTGKRVSSKIQIAKNSCDCIIVTEFVKKKKKKTAAV